MGASSGSEMGEREVVGGERAEEGEREDEDKGEIEEVVSMPFVIDGERSLSCSASCNNLRPYILKSPIEPLSGGRATMIHVNKKKPLASHRRV